MPEDPTPTPKTTSSLWLSNNVTICKGFTTLIEDNRL